MKTINILCDPITKSSKLKNYSRAFEFVYDTILKTWPHPSTSVLYPVDALDWSFSRRSAVSRKWPKWFTCAPQIHSTIRICHLLIMFKLLPVPSIEKFCKWLVCENLQSDNFLVDTMNQDIDNQWDTYELPTPESWLDHGIQRPTFIDRSQHSIYVSCCLLNGEIVCAYFAPLANYVNSWTSNTYPKLIFKAIYSVL